MEISTVIFLNLWNCQSVLQGMSGFSELYFAHQCIVGVIDAQLYGYVLYFLCSFNIYLRNLFI